MPLIRENNLLGQEEQREDRKLAQKRKKLGDGDTVGMVTNCTKSNALNGVSVCASSLNSPNSSRLNLHNRISSSAI